MKDKTDKRVRSERRFPYVTRQERALFVGRLFEDYLKSSVLDVGAGQGSLRSHVDGDYTAIDVCDGEGVDIALDIDGVQLPFGNASFTTVVCTDVLEHLDGLHDTFDELCRVASSFVILSLPNVRNLQTVGRILRGRDIKFYGLPVDPPEDRHRWFMGYQEARNFIAARAQRNGFAASEIFPQFLGKGAASLLARRIGRIILNRRLYEEYFSVGCWALLTRDQV